MMRFPHPVTVTCLTCGQPTVTAETAIGSVRVHCGTWRWQCDAPATERGAEPVVLPTGRTALTAVSDQELAA